MPPIQVYTKSPITAPAKASGVTPATAAPDAVSGAVPNGNGVQPTPTQPLRDADGPPAPQPGAVPRLPAATPTAMTGPAPPQTSTSASLSAPAPAAPEPTTPPQFPGISAPPQLGIPAPGSNPMGYNHQQRGTATATSHTGTFYQIPGTTAAGGPPASAQSSPYAHPPGYQQNAGGYQHYQGGADREQDSEQEGVWNSAMKWAQAAGKKLSDAESEVWRRVNKE